MTKQALSFARTVLFLLVAILSSFVLLLFLSFFISFVLVIFALSFVLSFVDMLSLRFSFVLPGDARHGRGYWHLYRAGRSVALSSVGIGVGVAGRTGLADHTVAMLWLMARRFLAPCWDVP